MLGKLPIPYDGIKKVSIFTLVKISQNLVDSPFSQQVGEAKKVLNIVKEGG
jgi:hypothetical protein